MTDKAGQSVCGYAGGLLSQKMLYFEWRFWATVVRSIGFTKSGHMKQDDKLKLTNINLRGYKSIDSVGQDIPIGDITILLGANGSGKSNLVSFFKMLNYMMTGNLQRYVGESGFADSLLYYGAKKTPRLTANLTFDNSTSVDNYEFSLSHATGDTLIFTEEIVRYRSRDRDRPQEIPLDPGSKESGLFDLKDENKTVQIVYNLLRGCQVFQFHDTSKEAKIRNSGYVDDANYLRSDAGNLAAFLYAMEQAVDRGKESYQRIVRYIRMMMPQFKDFKLDPSPLNARYILLNWLENESDYLFGPHQLSDGSLRFMALATLLLQPPRMLPGVIIVDEPELGLHPSAISILAGMIRMASRYSQILLATQSATLVDEFEANDVVIVERDEDRRCSIFKKLDEGRLSDWLERYSMSELWEKNVLGGRP